MWVAVGVVSGCLATAAREQEDPPKEAWLDASAGDTHGDVPGASAVGFVGRRESLAGHDARVRDQVAPALEGGPEREPERNQSAPQHLQLQESATVLQRSS